MVRFHSNLNFDKLKIHTINPKATTKITEPKVIYNKSKREIKWNHEKYSV